MKRTLMLLALAVGMGACSVAPSAPADRKAPTARALHDETQCEERSGYTVSLGRNGECVYTPQ